MLLRGFTHITKAIYLLTSRGYFSNRITTQFVNNFDKYFAKIKIEESSYKNKEVNHLLEEYNKLLGGIKDVEKELINSSSDKELLSLMKEEKLELEDKQHDLISRVLNEIHNYELSKDEEKASDSSSILFEVSAGVGGKEAMLFANELCNLYMSYINFKRWDVQDVESDEQGGSLRHFRAKIEGRDVWAFMRFEAGVHRVQRVPETEARGRVHTSTVSLACIPISNDVQIDVDGKQSS